MLKGYLLICRSAEGVHGKKKFGSPWSSQNGEICLQKYLPISGKLSITNYLKQTAVDKYRKAI